MPDPIKLHRRTFLRGSLAGASVTVGLGPLDAMFDGSGRAWAQASPRRLVMAFFPNGIIPASWVPPTQGAAPRWSACLEPVEPVRKYIRVVSGLDNTGGGADHAVGMGAAYQGEPDCRGTSADLIAARHLGQTRFSSLQYGLLKVNKPERTKQNLTFDMGKPLPPEFVPGRAFARLFGAGAPGPASGSPGSAAPDPSLERLRLRKLSVLDAVRRQVEYLKSVLGAADRAKLDAHLTSVRDLERSLAPQPATSLAATSLSCRAPVAPSPATPPDDYPAISRQMNQIIALALACDQTRAVSYMYGGCQCQDFLGWLDPRFRTEMWHDNSHGKNTTQDITKIVKWVMGEFADLVGRVAAIDEGGKKLIDSTILYMSSETGQADIHGGKDMPIVVAGGPALVGGDYHFRGTGAISAGVMLSVLKALGCPVGNLGRETRTVPII